MAFRYDTPARDHRSSSNSDTFVRGQAAAALETLDAHGITVTRRSDPHFVMGVYKTAKELGRIGSRAREDAAGTFDPVAEMLGGEILDTRLDAIGEDDDGPGDVVSGADAQEAMLSKMREAWRPENRRGAGPGRLGPKPKNVDDPEPKPFPGSSRSTHGAGQSAINSAAYEPRDLDEEHVDEPMFRGMEMNDPASMGQGEDDGSVDDAMGAMVARQKAAYLPGNRQRDRAGRGDGVSTSADGADDGGQAAMVAREAARGFAPLRRRGLPR